MLSLRHVLNVLYVLSQVSVIVLNTLARHECYWNYMSLLLTQTGVCPFRNLYDHLSLFLPKGDPLPPSLVDLVMNSPISSVDDLKRLLDVESVGKADPIQFLSDFFIGFLSLQIYYYYYFIHHRKHS